MKPLSRRQREVCVCMLLGLDNKETARRLGIGPRTAEGHRKIVLLKYGMPRAKDLVWKLFNEEEGRCNREVRA